MNPGVDVDRRPLGPRTEVEPRRTSAVVVRPAAPVPSVPDRWDVAVGAVLVGADALAGAARLGVRFGGPVARLCLRPPLVPPQRHPARVVEALARRGRSRRDRVRRELERVLSLLAPAVVERVLAELSLTDLIERHVDIDRLVSRVDVDAVAARVDVDAVASRVDIDAVLDRLDLTAVVRERVDLDALVATVDLEAPVARVDLDAAARRLDVAAVIARIDLAALAEQVIEAIDLPELLRSSTGSVTSEAVRGLRMQSVEADEGVALMVDRLFPRRRRRPDPLGTPTEDLDPRTPL